jgi:hypothetical protein
MTHEAVRTNVRLPLDLKKKVDRYTRVNRMTFTRLVKVALETELMLAATVKTGGRVILESADGTKKELVFR